MKFGTLNRNDFKFSQIPIVNWNFTKIKKYHKINETAIMLHKLPDSVRFN